MPVTVIERDARYLHLQYKQALHLRILLWLAVLALPALSLFEPRAWTLDCAQVSACTFTTAYGPVRFPETSKGALQGAEVASAARGRSRVHWYAAFTLDGRTALLRADSEADAAQLVAEARRFLASPSAPLRLERKNNPLSDVVLVLFCLGFAVALAPVPRDVYLDLEEGAAYLSPYPWHAIRPRRVPLDGPARANFDERQPSRLSRNRRPTWRVMLSVNGRLWDAAGSLHSRADARAMADALNAALRGAEGVGEDVVVQPSD